MQQKIQQQQTIFNGLFCQKNSKGGLICANKTCSHPGIVCLDQNCQCHKAHQLCQLYMLRKLVSKISEKRKKVPIFFNKFIQEKQEQILCIIDKLSQIREQLTFFKTYYGFNELQTQFYKNLQQKQLNNINGILIHQIIKKLPQQRKKIDQSFSQFLTKIKNKINQTINKFDEKIPFYDQSSLMTLQTGQKILHFVQEQTKIKPKKLQLIFKASKNEFSLLKLQQKCKDYRQLILILQTEYETIIGGYNPFRWQPSQNKVFEDINNHSFLFSITKNKKYSCYNRKYSIFNNKQLGFGFGGYTGRYDLLIGNDCQQKSSCFCHFPNSFSQANGNMKLKEQFLGSIQTQFKIKQYQTYAVKFK